MADVLANIAKGRVVEFYNRVENNDPANSAFIIVPFDRGATADDAIRDADTLSAAIALGTERAASNWNRKTITDADLVALPAPDDTNNRYDVDMPDLVWSPGPTAGAVTDLLMGYDSDTTAGTDANIILIGAFAFAITPDGSVVTAQVDPAGFFRAS